MATGFGRYEADGVALWGRPDAEGVTVAFTGRAGGVSRGAYATLNLGDACGDDPAAVAENRARALAAVGAAPFAGRLVSPRQVHGDHVVVVRSGEAGPLAAARAEARAGADAVVCVVPGVPVLLCFADCVPVVLWGPGGFAVAHSGWRGTLAGIAGKAARVLAGELGCDAAELSCAVGPHVQGPDYEVSADLAARFAEAFGPEAAPDGRHLYLARCVRSSLLAAGLRPSAVEVSGESTAGRPGRWFSYRASGGTTGRQGALALMGADPLALARWRKVGADE